MDKVVKREVVLKESEKSVPTPTSSVEPAGKKINGTDSKASFYNSIDVMDLSPEQRKHFKTIMRKLIELCYACKNAIYEEGLGLYEIRCKRDGKIYDENAWCEFQEYDPNYPKTNPRIMRKKVRK